MRTLQTIVLLISTLLITFSAGAADQAFSRESLYNVPIPWVDDAGKDVQLSAWAGTPVILTLVYTQCRAACPLTIGRLKGIQAALEKSGKSAQFVLVSMDSEHDLPEVLAEFKRAQNLDLPNWRFLWGRKEDVRKLSALIGASYQRSDDGKEFMHSNAIYLLNPQGEIGFALEGLSSSIDPLVAAISQPAA